MNWTSLKKGGLKFGSVCWEDDGYPELLDEVFVRAPGDDIPEARSSVEKLFVLKEPDAFWAARLSASS